MAPSHMTKCLSLVGRTTAKAAQSYAMKVSKNKKEIWKYQQKKLFYQDACDIMNDDSSRCYKCGYILFSEESYEDQGKTKNAL